MLKSVRRKISSQLGASVTFALLLFLVCAVVGSVVLTAGTAASGRFSKLAESDRKSSSVTSAAALLIDVFDGSAIIDTKTEKFKITETVHPLIDGDIPDVFPESIPGDDDESPDPSEKPDALLKNAIDSYLKIKSGDLTAPVTQELSIDHTVPAGVSSVDSSKLKVSIVEQIDQDGTVSFTLSSDGSDPYVITLVFNADVDVSESSNTSDVGISYSGDYSNAAEYLQTVIKQKTDTTRTSVTWRLTEVRRGNAS